jgi:hypothetical protein
MSTPITVGLSESAASGNTSALDQVFNDETDFFFSSPGSSTGGTETNTPIDQSPTVSSTASTPIGGGGGTGTIDGQPDSIVLVLLAAAGIVAFIILRKRVKPV